MLTKKIQSVDGRGGCKMSDISLALYRRPACIITMFHMLINAKHNAVDKSYGFELKTQTSYRHLLENMPALSLSSFNVGHPLQHMVILKCLLKTIKRLQLLFYFSKCNMLYYLFYFINFKIVFILSFIL